MRDTTTAFVIREVGVAVRKNMSCVGSNKCKAVSFGSSAPVLDVALSHSSLNLSFVLLPATSSTSSSTLTKRIRIGETSHITI